MGFRFSRYTSTTIAKNVSPSISTAIIICAFLFSQIVNCNVINITSAWQSGSINCITNDLTCTIYCEEKYSCGKSQSEFFSGPAIKCPTNIECTQCNVYCMGFQACSGSVIYGYYCKSLNIFIDGKDNNAISVYAPGNNGSLYVNVYGSVSKFTGSRIYSNSYTNNIIINCSGDYFTTNVVNATDIKGVLSYNSSGSCKSESSTFSCPTNNLCTLEFGGYDDGKSDSNLDLIITAPAGTLFMKYTCIKYCSAELTCMAGISSCDTICSDGECVIPTTFPTTLIPSSLTPTFSPFSSPTIFPININPTFNPSTLYPTMLPTLEPINPTFKQVIAPSVQPTYYPSYVPSTIPTIDPLVIAPSAQPTYYPSYVPSIIPTIDPSTIPTIDPSVIAPSAQPTYYPSYVPSTVPTIDPSDIPTSINSLLSVPTGNPTIYPTFDPNYSQIWKPTFIPTFDRSGSVSDNNENKVELSTIIIAVVSLSLFFFIVFSIIAYIHRKNKKHKEYKIRTTQEIARMKSNLEEMKHITKGQQFESEGVGNAEFRKLGESDILKSKSSEEGHEYCNDMDLLQEVMNTPGKGYTPR